MKRSNRQKPRRRPVNRPRRLPSARGTLADGLVALGNSLVPGLGTVGRGVGKLLGFGAYTAEEVDKILASRVPTMHATLDRGVRITHHEYLGDVKSSTGFDILKYPINPGLQVTFPWLSTVASAFQEWELNGCIFWFRSTSASALNSTNTALGQIIGATQYNPYMPAPANKLEMLGLSSAADAKPSEHNLYPVECKADMVLMRSKLIRAASVSDDLAKYDHGNFFLAAAGSQAVAVVGELHIVYDLTLKKPKLWSTASFPGWTAQWYGEAADSSYTLGTSSVFQNNNLGVTIDQKLNTVTIPAAAAVANTKYRFRCYWSGGSVTVVPPTVGNFLNCTATVIGPVGSLTSITSPASGVTATRLTVEAGIMVTESNKDVVFTVSTGTIPTGGQAQCVIVEMV